MVAVGIWRLYRREEHPQAGVALRLHRHLPGDPALKRALRWLLARERSETLWRFTDDAVLKLAAHKLRTGEILLYESVPERGGSRRQDMEPSAAAGAPAFPLEDRASRVFSPPPAPPDSDSLPDDSDAAAIAEVLKKAAASGAPFCEECLKAALSGGHA